jgi:transposase
MNPEAPPITDLGQTKPHVIREQVIHGTRYVYIDMPYWDKDKKQTRHKREYIGHFNKENAYIKHEKKELILNNTKSKSNSNSTELIIEENDTRFYTHKQIGATYLLDQIAHKIGVYDDLQDVYPETYKEILSLAYYITIKRGPLYKFQLWSINHDLPISNILSSQRISELLSNFDEHSKFEFCKKQAKRRLENECLAYDLSSISSYSKLIKKAKYGHNKDGDKLAQINIGLIVGEESLLPVYYRILPGNISDVTTIDKLIADSKNLGLMNLKFVMDRGFYSSDNIDNMIDKGLKFTIGAKNSLIKVQNFINDLDNQIKSSDNFIANHNIYGKSKIIYIPKKHGIKNFNIVNHSKSRIYMHLYLDSARAESESIVFQNSISQAIDSFKLNKVTEEQKNLLDKYCVLTCFSDDKFNLTLNNKAINDKIKSFGYFALFSNYIKNPKDAIIVYRNKDIVEKGFNNIKNRLKFNRTKTHSDLNLDSYAFLNYLSLIFMFYIHKQMVKNNLYKNYTLDYILEDLDLITKYKSPDNSIHYSEITKKQRELYSLLGINLFNIK